MVGRHRTGSLVRMVGRHVRLAVLVLVALARSIFAVTLEPAEVGTRSNARRSLTTIAHRCVVSGLTLQEIVITLGKASTGSGPVEGGLGMDAIVEKGDLVTIAAPICFLAVIFGMLLDSRIKVVPFAYVHGKGG